MITALKIDAQKQEMYEVTFIDELQEYYEVLDVSIIETVPFNNSHDLILDEEGRINGTKHGFYIMGNAFYGNGLIVKHDGEGGWINHQLSIDDTEILKDNLTYFVDL